MRKEYIENRNLIAWSFVDYQNPSRQVDILITKDLRPSPKVSPEEALRFLEDIRIMASEIDEPTVTISLRIPANILRSVKTKAKANGKKYQSLLVEYLRNGLREK